MKRITILALVAILVSGCATTLHEPITLTVLPGVQESKTQGGLAAWAVPSGKPCLAVQALAIKLRKDLASGMG